MGVCQKERVGGFALARCSVLPSHKRANMEHKNRRNRKDLVVNHGHAPRRSPAAEKRAIEKAVRREGRRLAQEE